MESEKEAGWREGGRETYNMEKEEVQVREEEMW